MKLRRDYLSSAAERFAVALDTGVVTPETEPLVTLARVLTLREVGSAEYHAETKARMLRAFALAGDSKDPTDRGGV